jgi:hypothetical protein
MPLKCLVAPCLVGHTTTIRHFRSVSEVQNPPTCCRSISHTESKCASYGAVDQSGACTQRTAVCKRGISGSLDGANLMLEAGTQSIQRVRNIPPWLQSDEMMQAVSAE